MFGRRPIFNLAWRIAPGRAPCLAEGLFHRSLGHRPCCSTHLLRTLPLGLSQWERQLTSYIRYHEHHL